MVEHGTRSMYVHYGCRCEECCKAEHEMYLKRTKSKVISRTRSKWSEISGEKTPRQESQKKHNKNRYIIYTHTKSYRNRIRWQDIAEKFGMKCAICGIETNPSDTWETNGRKCYGRTYPTVDHIISLKKGGEDSIENVQLCCKHCNSAKGAK